MFELFHPALQHQIISGLGFKSLRPVQEQAIAPILSGQNVLIVAPTAGGKTEAATFPAISRMLTEHWSRLSVLYVCPIKALLNNLHPRLERYLGLVGRRAGLWHGDTSESVRKRIRRDPPDLLLTTPESIESMLVSRKGEPATFFGSLQLIIIDEIHAFAGDDRGWHLMALLQRLQQMSGRAIQRVGLSATIGNPQMILDWMSTGSTNPRTLLTPEPGKPSTDADVTLDWVGSLENAGQVIAKAFPGEKRLVFLDRRLKAEALAQSLRDRQIPCHLTHSSLSRDERQQAEASFTSGTDAIIIATSVLELGVDVGDLDRVIQIDIPSTVSSFLQRMGRTGRRPGTRRNYLFLVQSSDGCLASAAGLLRAWEEGFVEPVVPPPCPWHVLAQQILALTLQTGGLDRTEIVRWLGPEIAPAPHVEAIVEHLLAADLLFSDQGLLWFGRKGEETYARRYFSSILSIIIAEPLVKVFLGNRELGVVHPFSFMGYPGRPITLILGGRSWKVVNYNIERQQALVEPATNRGNTYWRSGSLPVSYLLCQSTLRVLSDTAISPRWSRRCREKMVEVRRSFPYSPDRDETTLLQTFRRGTWWNYAGQKANTLLAHRLEQLLGINTRANNLEIRINGLVPDQLFLDAIKQMATESPEEWLYDLRHQSKIKFAEALPPALLLELQSARLIDREAIQKTLALPIRIVSGLDEELDEEQEEPLPRDEPTSM